jgi:hypothetical protein
LAEGCCLHGPHYNQRYAQEREALNPKPKRERE